MRTINTIAHSSMVNAYTKDSPVVEAEHVKAALERTFKEQT